MAVCDIKTDRHYYLSCLALLPLAILIGKEIGKKIVI